MKRILTSILISFLLISTITLAEYKINPFLEEYLSGKCLFCNFDDKTPPLDYYEPTNKTADVNVNRTEYWDDLDDPTDILTSQLNNDAGFINNFTYENVLIVSPKGENGYFNISTALGNASSGDVVLVYPGTYNENFTVPSGVDLIGLNSGGCIITYTGFGFGNRGPLWIFEGDNHLSGFSFLGVQTSIHRFIQGLGDLTVENVNIVENFGAMPTNTIKKAIYMNATPGGILTVKKSIVDIKGTATGTDITKQIWCISQESLNFFTVQDTVVSCITYTSGRTFGIYKAGASGYNFVGTTVLASSPSENGFAFWQQSGVIQPAGAITDGRIYPGGNIFGNWKRYTNLGHGRFVAPQEGGVAIITSGVTAFKSDAATTRPVSIIGASSQSADLLHFLDSDGNVLASVNASGYIGIGTETPTHPLEVIGNNSGISIYSEANVSATGYNTRTSVYDKTKGSALNYIQDSDYYHSSETINHSKFYGYVGEYEITDYSRPVKNKYEIEVCNEENECFNETMINITYPFTKFEPQVSINMEVDVLRQAIYELKIQNQELLSRIKFLEGNSK